MDNKANELLLVEKAEQQSSTAAAHLKEERVADQAAALQQELSNNAVIAKDETWIAVKPIEGSSKKDIVNIVSLSVDYDKVINTSYRFFCALLFNDTLKEVN